jgi:hypothetical protein
MTRPDENSARGTRGAARIRETAIGVKRRRQDIPLAIDWVIWDHRYVRM